MIHASMLFDREVVNQGIACDQGHLVPDFK
jgi:hypothetical protein